MNFQNINIICLFFYAKEFNGKPCYLSCKSLSGIFCFDKLLFNKAIVQFIRILVLFISYFLFNFCIFTARTNLSALILINFLKSSIISLLLNLWTHTFFISNNNFDTNNKKKPWNLIYVYYNLLYKRYVFTINSIIDEINFSHTFLNTLQMMVFYIFFIIYFFNLHFTTSHSTYFKHAHILIKHHCTLGICTLFLISYTNVDKWNLLYNNCHTDN